MTKQEKTAKITIESVGYGQYKILMRYRRKLRSHYTTNSIAVDAFNSEEERKHNKGYAILRAEIIANL